MSAILDKLQGPAAGDVSFRQLADVIPQMVWSTLPDGYHDYYNAQWYAFTGMPEGSTDGEGWNGQFHPDDQERAWARWRHSLATGDPYEIEYRLRHHSGQYRWTLGRARPIRDADGTIVRWVGTCTDIHEAKAQAEQNFILSRELSHRIKNIFAVVNGLIGLSARHAPELKGFARQLQERIASLGRAHDFVRPHSEESAPIDGPATVKALLHALLSPYPALEEGRLVISGDDLPIDDRGATPIGLVVHELATNANKYGALSLAEGRVDIDIARRGDRAIISWRESGGPPIDGEPKSTGFGTRLTEIGVVQQLGGTLTRKWLPGGLEMVVEVPVASLSRASAE